MGHKDEQGDQNVDEGKWICMLQMEIWKSLEKNMLWNTKNLGCAIQVKYCVNTKFWWSNGHIFNNKKKLNIKMRLLGWVVWVVPCLQFITTQITTNIFLFLRVTSMVWKFWRNKQLRNGDYVGNKLRDVVEGFGDMHMDEWLNFFVKNHNLKKRKKDKIMCRVRDWKRVLRSFLESLYWLHYEYNFTNFAHNCVVNKI
jgi:hypothetical protein